MNRITGQRSFSSSREARRYAERENKKKQREQDVNRWLSLSPEQRRAIIDEDAALKRIERNGITIEEVMHMEEEAYAKGVEAGKNSTFRSIFAAICLALHELHDFDDNQCTEVLNLVYDKAVYALTSAELVQEAFDEVGVELSFDGEGLNGPAEVKD